MSADRVRRITRVLPLLALGACSWFTDFRDQPKYEPWETENDSTPFRTNPQLSVPMHGMSAPGLLVSYRPLPNVIDSVAALVGANPVAADARSLENGRKSYQINCGVCHGVSGKGFQEAATGKYGVYAPAMASGNAVALSDGQIYGIIRNGRGMMPTYNRVPDVERWDIINYIRGLQGRHQVVTGPAGVPGETGATLPSATEMAPTRPAPYYNRIGSQAGIPLGRGATPAAPANPAADTAAARPPAGGVPPRADSAAPRSPAAASPADTTTRGSRT